MYRVIRIFNLNNSGWGRNNNDTSPSKNQNDNGPPDSQDLDQVWRDFNDRFKGLFSYKRDTNRTGSIGTSTPPSRGIPLGVSLIFIVLALLWLASGFYIVQEGQVAVVTQFGKYKKTTQAGFQWHLPAPVQHKDLVNVSQLRTFEVGFRGGSRNKVLPEALMLTTDENIVDMQFVVQYRLRADGTPDYLFQNRDPDSSVRQASETAMREVVGKKPMDFVLYEGRTQVAVEVQSLMQQILDRYQTGIQVSTVAIQNVQPPEQVQAAFDDAVKAGQDRERQINEGQAYANQVVPLASGQASRMLEQAEGYKATAISGALGNASRFNRVLNEYSKSPEVMRDRMYLDAMQEVFTESNKVLVDIKGSNNLLYLPLDKINANSPQGKVALSSDNKENNSLATNQQSGPTSSSSQQSRNTSTSETRGDVISRTSLQRDRYQN